MCVSPFWPAASAEHGSCGASGPLRAPCASGRAPTRPVGPLSRSPRSSTPATTSRCTACGSARTWTASCTPSAAAHDARARLGPRRTRPGGSSDELAAYGAEPSWFALGDLDIATHLVRTRMLDAGYPLSAGHRRAVRRAGSPASRLLPMTDERCETHVVVELRRAAGGRIHFQEWWVRHRAALPAHGVRPGRRSTTPSRRRASLEAIAAADVVLIAPSNPVVSIGTILGVPGDPRRGRAATRPVVGRVADHRRRAGARHGRRVPARDRRRGQRRGRRPALRRARGRRAARRLAGARHATRPTSPASRCARCRC